MNFNQQTVYITGGSSGLGRELALQLARAGARVVVFARREQVSRALRRD